MGFCARYADWSGEIFGCLAGSNDRFFPLVTSGGYYSLEPDLQKKWADLEWTIEQIAEGILSLSKAPHPLSMERFNPPCMWGYLTEHPTEELAMRRIANSRNAFIPLMAYLNYAIAGIEVLSKHQPQDGATPSWVTNLADKYNIDYVWMNEFCEHSYVRAMSLRVGTYIHWSKFNAGHILQSLIHYHVPVYVILPENVFRSKSIPDYLRFSREEYDNIPSHVPTPRISTDKNPRTRQRLSDTVESFFARQDRQLARLLKNESQADGIRRNVHALEASHFLANPDFERLMPEDALFFHWMPSRLSARSYVRTHLPSYEVRSVWKRYRIHQIRYNSMHNEWDLCSELQATSSVDFVDESPQESEATIFFGNITPSGDIGAVTQSMLAQAFVPKDPVTTDVQIPSTEYVLNTIYGYINATGARYEPPSNPITPKQLAQYLVETDLRMPTQMVPQALHFITYLLEGYQKVPADLYDLGSSENYNRFNWHEIAWTKDRMLDGVISLMHSSNPSLRIYVPSASYVAQVHRIRFKDDSVFTLASHFCRQGSRFHLGGLVEGMNPFENKEAVRHGLGFRSKNFKPDWIDYQDYVKRRNYLLSDRTVARAALMQGGLIWRLTLDALFEMDQSTEVETYFTPEDMDMEPTYLTQEDLGVIVGLYKIWTGESFTS